MFLGVTSIHGIIPLSLKSTWLADLEKIVISDQSTWIFVSYVIPHISDFGMLNTAVAFNMETERPNDLLSPCEIRYNRYAAGSQFFFDKTFRSINISCQQTFESHNILHGL